MNSEKVFKRKAYNQLLEWKKLNGSYAVLIEGARRVGKSTLAKSFGENEYKSYILIDFSNPNIPLSTFDDLNNLDLFFLRLQAETNIKLYNRESLIIFDEVQLFPKARQAIKHLVKDGRYDYIETGSLISIRKNVKDILIPSEEMKVNMFPMDFEEFLWAINDEVTFDTIQNIYSNNRSLGDSINNKLMKTFRIYMAVGGMPQAVEAYADGKNFDDIDFVKRGIINLYENDFMKIDESGRIGKIFKSIPSQLASNSTRFVISRATNKKKSVKDGELFYELVNSKTVLPCFNVSDPSVSLSQTAMMDNFKLYLCDVGLFVTMMFTDSEKSNTDIYAKLLRDKLDANLGYLYENAMAQMLSSNGYELFYHTWNKKDSTHKYEIDFLIRENSKIIPIEVKSGSIKSHASIDEFSKKYSNKIGERYLFSGHDIDHDGMLKILPMYLAPLVFKSK